MVFAWQRGAAVTVREFEAAAQALSARLPRKPYVVNLCEDRYAFTVAFAASLIAGQTTLLPPSRAPEAVRDSCAGHDAYTLTDLTPVLEHFGNLKDVAGQHYFRKFHKAILPIIRVGRKNITKSKE